MASIDERTKAIGEPGHLLAGPISALYRQRRVALVTFAVLASLTAILVAMLPRQYNAEMKLMVNNDRPAPGASSPQTPTDVDESQINSEIELMTNRGLLKRVVEATAQDGSAPMPAPLLEKQINSLSKHLQVEAARKSDIIEVTYADRDADHAEQVLRSVLTEYLDAHTRAHAAPGTYTFFKQQADAFAQRLANADAEMEQYEAQQGALDLPQEENLLVKGREETQVALLASTANIEADQNSLLEGHTSLTAAPSSIETEARSMPNQYAIERMRTLLVELRNKRSDLITNFPPTDRQVQDLDRQISITQGSLEAATREQSVERVTGINAIHQSLETELDHVSMALAAERARRGTLAQQVGQYDRRLSALASLKQRYAALERLHKQLEDNYLLYSRKEEEARAAEALDTERVSNISVIETPLAFHTAAQPKVALDMLLGWSLAFCLAVAFALGADRYWDGVRDADTLEEITGLPVLGMSPAVRSW